MAGNLEPDEWLVVSTVGQSIEGDDVSEDRRDPDGRRQGRTGENPQRGRDTRLARERAYDRRREIQRAAAHASLAFERGFKVVELKVPNPERPSQHWVFIPAALVAGLVWVLQGRRMQLGARATT